MTILVGGSASGKTTVLRILNEHFGFEKVTTYTTRPMRVNEEHGVDYWFLTDDEFKELIDENFFVEYACYNGWWYGTAKKSCTPTSVLITTPKGMRQASETENINILRIYIKVDERKRLSRLATRGDNPVECFRRIISDQGMFDGVEDECDYVIDADDMTPDELAAEINNIIRMEFDYDG